MERHQWQEPPAAWFVGISSEDGRLGAVTLSDEFSQLLGGIVDNHMARWIGHLKREVDQQAIESNSIVYGATGYTPQEIWDHIKKLDKTFKGQIEAPFPIYQV